MKHRFFLLTTALCAIVFISISLTSCREDAIIKSSLTPAVDNIHTFGIGPDFNNGTDNLPVITMRTKTAFEDSVVTSARSTGFPIFHVLGYANDPFAGKTTGSIYMQVLPTVAGNGIPAGTTIDEMYLVLPYAGFTWGDTMSSSIQTVNVYPVADSFLKDSTYYNSSRLKTELSSIGSATFNTGKVGSGGIDDSVLINGVNRAPQLRIKLSQSFVDLFKNKLAASATYPDFTSTLPGLCIVPDTNGAAGLALPYFRLNGTADLYGSAAIVVYGHDANNVDTAIQFPYQEAYAAHFNRITRNYNGSEANNYLLSNDSDASVVVMQNGPGLAVDVVLPYIQNLPAGVIINKAELVFTKYPSTGDDRFFGPARLYPSGVNTANIHYTIADRYPITDQSLNFIDGTPTTRIKNGTAVTEYRINIPREVQQAMVTARAGGLHLRIGGTVNFPAAYRIVLGGHANANPIYRPSVNIIYSKQ